MIFKNIGLPVNRFRDFRDRSNDRSFDDALAQISLTNQRSLNYSSILPMASAGRVIFVKRLSRGKLSREVTSVSDISVRNKIRRRISQLSGGSPADADAPHPISREVQNEVIRFLAGSSYFRLMIDGEIDGFIECRAVIRKRYLRPTFHLSRRPSRLTDLSK